MFPIHLRRVALAAVAAVGVLVFGAFAVASTQAQDTPANDQTFAAIYQSVSPSVVAISVTKDAGQQIIVNPLDPNNQPQPGGVEHALGSGFVIDDAGHIVTNDHVVADARSIEVAFFDGTLARAHVVGVDPDSDIAVIQVEDVPADLLVPVTFGSSDDLFVGQTVLAIGSPFGERWTLTSGIVSGMERIIHSLSDFSVPGAIQTDAAINPGNSGGPLLNLEGQVIGVNAQIATGSGSNAGVGFAIPSDLVQRVAQQLIDQGYVQYSYLGLSGGDITLDAIDALRLPADTRGIVVGDVANGGPAARAGLNAAAMTGTGADARLESADIITAINDQPLLGMADLITYLAEKTKPGDVVMLSVLRDGNPQQIQVTLTPRPS